MVDKQPHSGNGGCRERIMQTKTLEEKVQTVKEVMFIIGIERRNHAALWPFKLLRWGTASCTCMLGELQYFNKELVISPSCLALLKMKPLPRWPLAR